MQKFRYIVHVRVLVQLNVVHIVQSTRTCVSALFSPPPLSTMLVFFARIRAEFSSCQAATNQNKEICDNKPSANKMTSRRWCIGAKTGVLAQLCYGVSQQHVDNSTINMHLHPAELQDLCNCFIGLQI